MAFNQKEYDAARYAANREESLAKSKAYYKANREQIKAKNATNPEKKAASLASWKANNPEKVAASRVKQSIKIREQISGCTPEQYMCANYAQGGRCAVCMEPGYGKSLCADHDHESGEFRGLLCHRCNMAEGLLRGNAWNLARYLDDSRAA